MDQTPRRLMRGMMEASRSPKVLPMKKFPLAEEMIQIREVDSKTKAAATKTQVIQEEIIVVKTSTAQRMQQKASLSWYEWILVFINVIIFLGVLYTLAIFLRAFLFLHGREVTQYITTISIYLENAWTSSGLSSFTQYLPEIDYSTPLSAYLPEIDYNTPSVDYILQRMKQDLHIDTDALIAMFYSLPDLVTTQANKLIQSFQASINQ